MKESLYNPIIEEMKTKEVVKYRTITFLGDFNEESSYKWEHFQGMGTCRD